MFYMLIIYDNAAFWARATEAHMEKTMQRHGEIVDDLKKAGGYHGCAALMPPESATCIRLSGGKMTMTDGPYAETKEHIGGYYLLEARDLDEAIGYARRLPLSDPGAVEVRPIRQVD
jgi:hypothetical protein